MDKKIKNWLENVGKIDHTKLDYDKIDYLLKTVPFDVSETNDIRALEAFYYLKGLSRNRAIPAQEKPEIELTEYENEGGEYMGQGLVTIEGRGTTEGKKKRLFYLPEDVFEVLEKSGNINSCGVGLIQYAIEQLKQKKRGLHIKLNKID